MPTTRLLSTVLVCLCAAGCGSKSIYPLSGKIVYSDNQPLGKELAGYLVRMESLDQDRDGRTLGATGVVGDDGSFTVGTEQLDDGALLGKHRVTIFPPLGEGGDKPRPRSILLKRYEKYDTSGLQIVVEPKKNEVVLTVERLK